MWFTATSYAYRDTAQYHFPLEETSRNGPSVVVHGWQLGLTGVLLWPAIVVHAILTALLIRDVPRISPSNSCPTNDGVISKANPVAASPTAAKINTFSLPNFTESSLAIVWMMKLLWCFNRVRLW